ncbi:hypothetical protein C1646_263545 [Rhizophagus diaphanus]|nr:hypothetical protein C1646_263545 [Rhizophagus diaphanus] [Rhizophagus sp. MUCL 43196]
MYSKNLKRISLLKNPQNFILIQSNMSLDVSTKVKFQLEMRLDNECTTDSGKYLLGKLRNAREGFYLLYAVSGACKTRTIFDIAMNNDGIYVVYMECRTADDGSFIQLEPTKDRNFKRLVDSIRSASQTIIMNVLEKNQSNSSV